MSGLFHHLAERTATWEAHRAAGDDVTCPWQELDQGPHFFTNFIQMMSVPKTTISIRGVCRVAIIGERPVHNVPAIGLGSTAGKPGAGAIVIGSTMNAIKSQVDVIQSNPLNRSPDNGSIPLLVQYFTGPIL